MLDSNTLAQLATTKLAAKGFTQNQHASFVPYLEALSDAIVEHITQNAVVTVEVKGGSSGGKHNGTVA